jgi:hypothetical protein
LLKLNYKKLAADGTVTLNASAEVRLGGKFSVDSEPELMSFST